MNVRKTLTAIAGLMITGITNATSIGPIIGAFELTDLLEAESATVLEIRSDEKAYLDKHIPGSVHIPYAEFRGPDKNPGKLPDVTQLANVLGTRGIDFNKPVVIVHDGVTPTDFGAASRAFSGLDL